MEATAFVSVPGANNWNYESSGIATPQDMIAVPSHHSAEGSTEHGGPSGAIPPPVPSKRKKRGTGAPWQTHIGVTPVVTNGYGLRKRKSPPIVEATSVPTAEFPKKRVRKKALPPTLVDASAAARASKSSPGLGCSYPLAAPTSRKRVPRETTHQGSAENSSGTAVAATTAAAPMTIETSGSGTMQGAVYPTRTPNERQERARDPTGPSVASMVTYHSDVPVLDFSRDSDNEWNPEGTVEEEEVSTEIEEDNIDDDDWDWSECVFTEEGRQVVPATEFLLEDKQVDICACGRILGEEREIPPEWMSQHPNPRDFLLGGFTDTKLEQALKDKLNREQTKQDTALDEWLMFRLQAHVREYAQQFHDEVFAVQKIGENICELYENMDTECEECQAQSRTEIQRWKHQRDMIFDYGLAALGMHAIQTGGAVRNEHGVLELRRVHARAQRQLQEAQCREWAHWQNVHPH